MELLLDMLCFCNAGGSVMIIKKGRGQKHFEIGNGWLFLRGWSTPTLISVKVDTVVFLDKDVPNEILNCIESHQWRANIIRS